jgi:hypothetical protein
MVDSSTDTEDGEDTKERNPHDSQEPNTLDREAEGAVGGKPRGANGVNGVNGAYGSTGDQGAKKERRRARSADVRTEAKNRNGAASPTTGTLEPPFLSSLYRYQCRPGKSCPFFMIIIKIRNAKDPSYNPLL